MVAPALRTLSLICPAPGCGWRWDVQVTPATEGHFAARHVCPREKCRSHWVAVYLAAIKHGRLEVEGRGITYDEAGHGGLQGFAEALRRIQEWESVAESARPILDDEIEFMLASVAAQVAAAPPPVIPDAAGRILPPDRNGGWRQRAPLHARRA